MANKILIIDDDRDILEMLTIVFRDFEFEVVSSETGMTADEVKILNPDVILLDIQIKGYKNTGDEICKEIKAREDLSYIRVLLVSSEENLEGLAYECKADGYLPKPFDIVSLLSMIKEKPQ